MQNFSVVRAVVASVETYLIDSVPDGVCVAGVTEYNRMLISKGRSSNTIKTYVRALAKYLDFVVEYIKCAVRLGVYGRGVSFERILHYFFESLSVGYHSDDPCLSMVCRNLKRKVVKRRTINIYRSALRAAFAISDKFVYDYEAVVNLSSFGREKNQGIGFVYQGKYTANDFEISRLNRTSYLAGCISGGVKNDFINLLPKYYRGSSRHYVGELRLCFKKFAEVIPTFSNLRDRCLLALLAAGGMRISEALQMLSIDIDVDNKKIRAVDPNNRLAMYYEMGLTPVEVSSLRWKGRKGSDVFLIPPFESLFWRYYSELLVSDKFPQVDANGKWITHKFIFMVAKGATKGRPLILASEGMIRKSFKRILKAFGVDNVSPHDIRHCYVSFLSNEVVNSNGRGLGLEVASDLVGHVNIESTKNYDHLDRVAIKSEIELGYIDMEYYSGGVN